MKILPLLLAGATLLSPAAYSSPEKQHHSLPYKLSESVRLNAESKEPFERGMVYGRELVGDKAKYRLFFFDAGNNSITPDDMLRVDATYSDTTTGRVVDNFHDRGVNGFDAADKYHTDELTPQGFFCREYPSEVNELAVEDINRRYLSVLNDVSVLIQKEGATPADLQYEKDKTELFYQMLEKEIIQGKPVVVSCYVGLWGDSNMPEHDLHWGKKHGVWRMLERAPRDTLVSRLLTYHDWKLLYSAAAETDPVRTNVYHMTIHPNTFWRSHGVSQPFDVVLSLQAYRDRSAAFNAAEAGIKSDTGGVLQLPNYGLIDLGAEADIVGYMGHNIGFDGLLRDPLPGASTTTRGVFAIGCSTSGILSSGQYSPSIDMSKNLETPHTISLAFTKSFMAPEGYTLLPLIDGISAGVSLGELRNECNHAYKEFQVIEGKQKKPGDVFIVKP